MLFLLQNSTTNGTISRNMQQKIANTRKSLKAKRGHERKSLGFAFEKGRLRT